VCKRGRQTFFQFRTSDVTDDVHEEPERDESTRFRVRDATSLQIEKVLIVQSAGRASVTGSRDVTGFYFEVGN
jgi:hypothetical protein